MTTVDFAFTPEQEALREAVRSLFAKVTGPPLWSQLTEQIGAVSLVVDGGTLVEAGIVIEEAGRVLAPVPYLSTVVTAVVTGRVPSAGAVALSGTLTADGTRLNGFVDQVLDGEVAETLVVAAGEQLYAVEAKQARITRLDTLDQTRGQARLEFSNAPAEPLAVDVAHALNLMHTALAVESVGLAGGSLARTIEYLKAREQFGRPLATFQALRHRVADLAVQLEAATSTAWYALRLAAQGDPEWSVAAPMAKLVATEAAYAITAEAIQLHGGIGFTWEHDAHRYFKRATANRLLHGDPVSLRRLVATRAGLA